jgi:hypothetical protein
LAVFIGRSQLVIAHHFFTGHRRGAGVTARSSAWGARRARSITVLGVLLAVALPFLPFSSRYLVDLGTTVLIYVMLGWGLNVVVGLAGLLDLGIHRPRHIPRRHFADFFLGGCRDERQTRSDGELATRRQQALEAQQEANEPSIR